jgi:hypothetical protein
MGARVGKRTVRGIVTFVFVVLGLGALINFQPVDAQKARPPSRRVAAHRTSKYSTFDHATKAHRMDCAKCHNFPSENWKNVRDASTAFPDITDYPKHESCLRCHQQQFFKGSPPAVCSICHTAPGPRDSARHPYPNPREVFDPSPKGKTALPSDFVVEFPHTKHIDIVSSIPPGPRFIAASYTRAAEESCAVCHQTMKPQDKSDVEFLSEPPKGIGDAFWLKKGTFKSAPIGHTTCFACHSADTGILPAPSSCAACHVLRPPQPASDFDPAVAKLMIVPQDKVMRDAWATRHSSGTFRHEWFSHAELACATCHNVLTMKTSDPQTMRVAVTSCATCHVTATSDDGGAMNYEVDARNKNPKFTCTKCHVTFGKQPIPPSHIKAIADAAGK